MDIRDVIAKKRDGRELTTDEIAWFVANYTEGRIPDVQMAALLMAIVLRDMSARETADLTLAMLNSGERLDLSSIPGIKVDKHSTGGVGDKTTLVVAPLVASFGVPVPKMAGRALGHTGGTIDKLECIPGLTTELSPQQFTAQIADIGVAIAAQSERMVPADRKIYALRNLTGTTESVPLIASSVMSKKLAVGADAIVLDVKAGRGALAPDVATARRLARAMVEIGARAGKKVVAIVTRMDEPLGRAVGDSVELVEAIETLRGRGPRDFVHLCALVAGHMLALGGAVADERQGRVMAKAALRNGAGLAKLRELIRSQHGDPSMVEDPTSLTRGAELIPIRAKASGYVTGVDARIVGEAVRDLKSATGDRRHLCGVLLQKKTNDPVVAGDTIALVVVPGPAVQEIAESAAGRIAGAFQIGPAPIRRRGLLIAVLRG